MHSRLPGPHAASRFLPFLRLPLFAGAKRLIVVAAAMIVVSAPNVQAATITVTTTDDELNADGDCSLREAITAANTNLPVDACPAGQASPTVDIIDFSGTGTIALASTLPSIVEVLTIDGPGAASLTISGGGAVRVLDIGAGATLTLRGLTVANGRAGSDGGGSVNAPG